MATMETMDKLSALLCDHHATLSFEIEPTCRCLGCWAYQIKINDLKILEDSLVACIDAAYNLISQPNTNTGG